MRTPHVFPCPIFAINIDKDEIKALLELAEYLALDEDQIELAVHSGKFMEVYDDDDKTCECSSVSGHADSLGDFQQRIPPLSESYFL
jgi:hypothetical protein